MVIAIHAGPKAMSSWTSHSSRVPGQWGRRKAATPSTSIIHWLSSQLPIRSIQQKLLIFLFKSCYVAQGDFTLTILLHQPPEQQDYRCELWHPAWGTFLIPWTSTQSSISVSLRCCLPASPARRVLAAPYSPCVIRANSHGCQGHWLPRYITF